MTNILVWELLLSFRLNWYFEAEGRATLKGEYLIWSACIFVNSDICLNIENSNYFLPNLWINAIFLQCCAFILRHVVCHYYKASLFLLFYWSFPQCASVVLTESTERCSVLIHAFFFFFNIRYLIALFWFFFLSPWLLLKICLVWLLSSILSPLLGSSVFPSLPCFGRLIL